MQEAINGFSVRGPCVVVLDVCREEFHKLPLSLLSRVLDQCRNDGVLRNGDWTLRPNQVLVFLIAIRSEVAGRTNPAALA